jgi:peptidoglycan/xylan/chitin deacetylase (PgdA/CDA1 family)
LAVEPVAFARQCAWIARNKTVLPLHEAVGSLDSTGRLPRGVVALTFDDGFQSVYDHALPLLTRHGLPATVFLVAQTLTAGGKEVDWVDTPPPYRMRTLEVDQIREMQDAGVRFESHTFAHLDLTQLALEECVRDLRESRTLLESLLGHEVRLLAYPRGRHNELVRLAARQAGYTHAFSLPEGREPVGPYSVPRVGLHRGNSVATLRLKTVRPYLPVRTGAAYSWAVRARQAARKHV